MNPRRDSQNEQITILLERQKEQILADYRAEIQKHEFQADYDRINAPELNGVVESQRGEIHRAQAEERLRRDHQLLHGTVVEAKSGHSKLMRKVSMMEDLKDFKHSMQLRLNGPPDIGTRIAHRETFLQIQPRLPQYLILSN